MALLTLSCAPPHAASAEIIGTWSDGSGHEFSFYADGTASGSYEWTLQQSELRQRIRLFAWSENDSGEYDVDMVGLAPSARLGQSYRNEAVVSGDTLILDLTSGAQSRRVTLHRAPASGH